MATLLYLISDRRELGIASPPYAELLDMIAASARAGIDMIQLRERDLPARELLELARAAKARVANTPARVFVNDRFDVALAAGADGVHLTSRSLSPAVVRTLTGPRLGIGVSAHSREDVRAAAAGGADFCVCGPIFDTPSKRELGRPLGLDAFAEAAQSADIPVLGIGGVDASNARDVVRVGGAGVAGIRVFHSAWSLGGGDALVRAAESLRRQDAQV